MQEINIQSLIEQMRRFADENPFRPGLDDILKYGHWIKFNNFKLKITLTRTVVGRRQFYQFSMGPESGNPRDIPAKIVNELKQAFVPRGIQLPSALGNTYQWVQPT